MLSQIKKWLAPPVFPGDEEKNRFARLVNILGLYFALVVAIAALIFVPIFSVYKALAWTILGLLMVVYLISRQFLFQGKVRLSAGLFVLCAWGIFEVVAVFSGGIYSPALHVVLVMIILISLLIQERIGVVIFVLSVLIGLVLAVLQNRNVELPTWFVFSPLARWFWYALALGFAFGALQVIMRNLQNALNIATQQTRARQDAEAILRQSQARLQQAQNLAQVGVWEWDPKTDVTIWSDEMLRIYGLTREEFTGHGEDYINFTLPEDRSLQRENIRRDFDRAAQFALASGEQVDIHPDPKDFRIVRKDGAVRWVRGDAVEIVDAQGNPLRMYGILWDVTDQKESEQKIRASEARFRAIVEYSHDGIIFLDRQRTIVYVSPSYAQINGRLPQELLGQTGMQYVHPDDLDLTSSLFADLHLVPGKTVLAEYRILHKDGSWRWIETKATNLLEEPNVQAVVLNSRDVTDRKSAEEEIIKLKLGIEYSNDAIFVTDPAGIILYTNLAFEKIYGYTRQEAVGNTPRIIKSGHLSPENYQNFWDKLLGKHSVSGEIVNKTKDGRLLFIEGSNNPILDANGKIIGFMGIHRDISERRLAEERIQISERKYRDLFEANKDGISIFIISADRPTGNFIEVNEASYSMLGYTREEMLNLTPETLEPDLTAAVLQLRQAQLQSEGFVNFETALAHKDGHRVYAEFVAQLIQYEGQLAVMNIVHDLTDRKQRELELETIATLSEAMRTAMTRGEMLPVIVQQLVGLLNADSVSVEIIDQETGDSVVEAAHGTWEHLVGSRQKKGTGLNSMVSQTLKPYYTSNLEKDPNLPGPAWVSSGMREIAGVPLIAQGNLIGFIWMGRRSNIFAAQTRLLLAVADIAANAIHRSTLHEQTQNDAAALKKAYDTTLEGWARALELRDQETEGHSQRVTDLTLRLAREFGFDTSDLIHIRRGAILHDIGKMGIADAILHKPGPLTEEEWEIMRKHPQYAYDLLSSIEHLQPALDIPYAHHEKWDGSGYPRKLQGEQIPLAARIFAVVDVWDALRTDRVYRKGWPETKVRDYITAQSGIHFDPQVVELFLKLVDGKPVN